MEYAIPGFYACGASVRVDPYTNDVDDVGVFGLRIAFCKRSDTSVNY